MIDVVLWLGDDEGSTDVERLPVYGGLPDPSAPTALAPTPRLTSLDIVYPPGARPAAPASSPEPGDAFRRAPRPWPDLVVRRLVRASLASATAALRSSVEPPAFPSVDHGTAQVGAAGASLTFAVPRTAASEGEYRLAGAVRARRRSRAVPVEVVIGPWSTATVEVRLQVRCRRHPPRLPRHYFDVAHLLLDEVRVRIEASAALTTASADPAG